MKSVSVYENKSLLIKYYNACVDYFKKVNDTVYSTGDINVRKSYSTDSSVVGHLKEGEEIKTDIEEVVLSAHQNLD